MKIEFSNGLMTVTHDSGHVDTYDKKHLEDYREEIISEQAILQNELDITDNRILDIEATISP